MLTLKINTRNKKTLQIQAESVGLHKGTFRGHPASILYKISLCENESEKLILSCDANYFTKEDQGTDPIASLSTHGGYWADIAKTLYGTRKSEKKKIGNILSLALVSGNYYVDESVLFAEEFDMDALIRGMRFAAECFLVKQDVSEHFVFIGMPGIDPIDAQWDQKLKSTNLTRKTCGRHKGVPGIFVYYE